MRAYHHVKHMVRLCQRPSRCAKRLASAESDLRGKTPMPVGLRRLERVRIVLSWIAATLLVGLPAPLQAFELWISAPEAVTRAAFKWPPNDYMALFSADAKWVATASRVDVFDLTARFVLNASDADFAMVVHGLKERNIALSVQAEALTFSESCGMGIEGYSSANEITRMVQRLKSVGADLRYIRLDEPVFFGHAFKGIPGRIPCKTSLKELAEQTATKVRPLITAFPNLIIGQAEPYGGGVVGPAWIADIVEFQRLFRAQLGYPISFFDADIVWAEPSAAISFSNVASILKAAGLQIGVIYHGTRDAESDEAWSSEAMREARIFEGDLGVTPDHVSIQSWMDRPRRMLPEGASGTLTNTIAQYIAYRHQKGRSINSHACEVCK
jgi:hypothetical protein